MAPGQDIVEWARTSYPFEHYRARQRLIGAIQQALALLDES